MTTHKSVGIGAVILLLFFISGSTGLIYEVVWTRFFTIAYGNTTYGVSAVLTAFMAGLGLGSYVFGRFIDGKKDMLFIYAMLEICMALIAIAMPHVLESLQVFYASIFTAFPSDLWLLQTVRTLLSFFILVIPTFLMGATLPVLTRFYVSKKQQVGGRVALLYAMNTLGATVGCFLTGFVFIKAFGLENTVYFAAAINILIAIAFLVLRRLMGTSEALVLTPEQAPEATQEKGEDDQDQGRSRRQTIILLSFAVAGFTSLAYEVLWFRLLVFHMQTSIYAFTIMLTTFLGGIGLGSIIFSAFQKKSGDSKLTWEYFGFIQAAIGMFGLMSIMLFGSLDMLDTFLMEPFWKYAVIQFSAASMIMLIPTLLMGAAFPVVCKIVSNDISRIGGSVGKVYAANTVGAIFGAFVTGFILVRTIGTQHSLILMGVLNILVASVILINSPIRQPATTSSGHKRRLPNIGIVAALWIIVITSIVTIPADYLFQYYNVREVKFDSGVKILHAEEGLESITTVHQYPNGDRTISAGSINVAGTLFTHRTTQILQAHIPMLLMPDASEVVQIGFGSGETAHLVTTYDNVERLDLVDISQSVLTTSAKFFTNINYDVVKDPKFHPTIMDGANYLRLTDKKYDVIMNDSIWPFYAGNSGLYTKDYFAAGKAHLKKGGIMTSWLPLQIDPEDFKILLHTFQSVFPHTSIWVAMTHFNKHALLIGSEKKLEIDMQRFVERYERFAKSDLKIIEIDSPIALLNTFVMDEDDFASSMASSKIHTENNPILEFSTSRQNPDTVQLRVYEFLRDHASSPSSYLVNISPEGGDPRKILDAASRAGQHVMNGLIMIEKFQANYEAEFKKALQIWPDHAGAQKFLKQINALKSTGGIDLSKMGYRDLALLGDQLMKNRVYQKAYPVFMKMLELSPNDAKIHVNLGLILGQLKKYEQAENHFKKSVQLNPDYFQAYNNYGVLLAKMGNLKEAIKKQQKVLELNPGYVPAHMQLGVLFRNTKQFDAAISHLKDVLSKNPGHWPARKQLTIAYYENKQYGDAWNELHKLQDANIRMNPSFISALKKHMVDPREKD